MPAFIDRTDRAILQALADNARISNAELAERVHLTPTPCLRRLRRLEESGIIQGYTLRLDNAALGLGISALIFVQLERNSLDNANCFEAAVRELPEVTECSVLTGGHDYLLRVTVEDLAHYERFVKESLASIPQVANIDTRIVLKQVLSRSMVPLPDAARR
ncbi:MAG: Lrp/AsnC family transcriptional regulator [Haliea sp.]|uniref:Lrp/AsnC family transcriptional regulator n=1 Tax=Haliea sp. TaxID=1932666 RepID=UPI0032EC5319